MSNSIGMYLFTNRRLDGGQAWPRHCKPEPSRRIAVLCGCPGGQGMLLVCLFVCVFVCVIVCVFVCVFVCVCVSYISGVESIFGLYPAGQASMKLFQNKIK